nr:hypothetical protein [Roseovarius atlanticus]
MRSVRTIHVVSAHAEGEVGDVIVDGVLPPPGDTIWQQGRWIAGLVPVAETHVGKRRRSSESCRAMDGSRP